MSKNGILLQHKANIHTKVNVTYRAHPAACLRLRRKYCKCAAHSIIAHPVLHVGNFRKTCSPPHPGGARTSPGIVGIFKKLTKRSYPHTFYNSYCKFIYMRMQAIPKEENENAVLIDTSESPIAPQLIHAETQPSSYRHTSLGRSLLYIVHHH